MEEWETNKGELEEGFVEALEDGKIVRVSADYAKKEGLVVLRRGEKKKLYSTEKRVSPLSSADFKPVKRKSMLDFDELRKPLDWKKDQVVGALVENFHWIVTAERRKKNLTRTQAARAMGIEEHKLKLVENGVLQEKDFLLINKIQDFYKINLRKDKQNFSQTMRTLVESPKKEVKDSKKEEAKKNSSEEVIGKDIELEY